jgi:hypothetical protein
VKKRTILFIGLGLILMLLVINGFGPYNVFATLTANNLAGYPEIQSQLDGKILNIKYIGKDTYQVLTDRKDYILLENNSD